MLGFLVWLFLLFLCWPLALLALVLYPVFLLLLLPFRLIGIGVEAVFELLRAIVMLPARVPVKACSRIGAGKCVVENPVCVH